MTKRTILTALFALSFAGCAAQQVAKEPTDPTDDEIYAAARASAVNEMMRNFQRVHFDFDSAMITDDSREPLATNAEIMRRFDEIRLEVEGHCDEQGATEYNLQLGQRRGDAIRKYLLSAGVGSERVTVISYGEEKPLFGGTSPEDFAQNRRAEFRVTVDPTHTIHGTVASASEEGDTLARR